MTHAQVRNKQENKKKNIANLLNEAETKVLTKIENKIRGLKNEQLHVVDGNGNIIFKKNGNSKSVAFTLEDAIQFEDKIVTHNHPPTIIKGIGKTEYGGTFSPADVSVAVDYKVKQIRAVAAEGTYTLTRTDKADGNGLLKYLNGEKSNMLIKKEKISHAVAEEYRKGKFTSYDEYLTENRKRQLKVDDDFYSENAFKYGYEYKFTSLEGVTKMHNALYCDTQVDIMKKEDIIVLDEEHNNAFIQNIINAQEGMPNYSGIQNLKSSLQELSEGDE